ncbi:MAG: TIGR01777 family oxidoreductase [Ferruginibacter sp.]
MKNKKIIIAGGSGFIGQALCNYFGNDNYIVILGRQLPHRQSNSFGVSTISKAIENKIRFVKWDAINTGVWINELEGADLVINLAGKTVNCRYNKKNKQEIFDSRTNTTAVLAQAIRAAKLPPKLWINAASATIYPNATDTPRDESFTDFNNDFSVQVCKLWEKTFYEEQTPSTRKVMLRMAITLGAGGVMIPYFNLLKFGLGGKQGNGKQMYSWIHVTDTCSMIDWIDTHEELEGTFNCCSPNPVSNDEFMKTLRNATGYSFGLPAYKWMLKIGAALIGTETELILKSRWVLPTRIMKTGFQFNYPKLPGAMKQIISNTPEKQYRLFA